jgi:hypothetical protein
MFMKAQIIFSRGKYYKLFRYTNELFPNPEIVRPYRLTMNMRETPVN